MRKVILAMQTTLDDYVAGPDGELDWIFAHIDDELYGFICETLSENDTTLKRLPGKNIGATGGPTFVRPLLRDGLIDEIRLTIHPITLGRRIALFAQPQTLTLIGSRRFDSGAVVNTYQAVRSWREAS
jgi:hypothetical protein